MTTIGAAALALACVGTPIAAAGARVERPKPVRVVAPERFVVGVGAQAAPIPLFASDTGSPARHDVVRVVIVVHGLNRNASGYFDAAMKARDTAGPDAARTLVLAPQFLATDDIAAHRLPATLLHWPWNRWASGEPASGPLPISPFEVLDELLRQFADPAAFPALKQVVVAGHSAGGQLVQRYAVVGHGDEVLTRRGVAVRYVVADPSSYLYFGAQRPFKVPAPCPARDRWRYGLAGGVPRYVTLDATALEQRYVRRDVVYLLGEADTDPNHPALDRSCAALAQGPERHARGLAYFATLQARDGASLRHRVVEVPGIGHDGERLFTSEAAVRVLFREQN
ncbi:MAG TPA: alpha/beta hydrolase [Burkholderiaceae bacterium]|nr:alpha/beta hydrolase [Burkholderiaceae bacterium]